MDFTANLKTYLDACLAAWKAANPDSNDTFDILYGSRYARVVRVEGDNEENIFVHSFIDTKTGDIYKAASAKAPAMNHVRASLFDDDCGVSVVGPNGLNHLKRGRKAKMVLVNATTITGTGNQEEASEGEQQPTA